MWPAMKREVRLVVVAASAALILLWNYHQARHLPPQALHTSQLGSNNWADDEETAVSSLREEVSVSGLLTSSMEHGLTREKVLPDHLKTEPSLQPPDDPPLKKILLWNDWYGKPHYGFGLGRQPFVRAGCPVNTCITTAVRDRYPLDQLDALVWHFRAKDKTLPDHRWPHTRYVFWMMESPQHLFGDLEPYHGLFNWTFTYRLDSDFPSPYGFVTNRRHQRPPQEPSVDVAGLVGSKTKLVAWFVSNCASSSGRESLARTLQQYLPVDVYGKCGPLSCARAHQTRCYDMLQKDYKFYLAFENSLCRDYITEKFFSVLEYYVVPVVWGLGNYKSQAPPHSYIDAFSFPSVHDLAQYLLYLDANHTAYKEYFQWKQQQRVVVGWASTAVPWCRLCERLHTDKTTKVYHDLHSWFVADSCRSSTDRDVARYVHGETRDLDSNEKIIL